MQDCDAKREVVKLLDRWKPEPRVGAEAPVEPGARGLLGADSQKVRELMYGHIPTCPSPPPRPPPPRPGRHDRGAGPAWSRDVGQGSRRRLGGRGRDTQPTTPHIGADLRAGPRIG